MGTDPFGAQSILQDDKDVTNGKGTIKIEKKTGKGTRLHTFAKESSIHESL